MALYKLARCCKLIWIAVGAVCSYWTFWAYVFELISSELTSSELVALTLHLLFWYPASLCVFWILLTWSMALQAWLARGPVGAQSRPGRGPVEAQYVAQWKNMSVLQNLYKQIYTDMINIFYICSVFHFIRVFPPGLVPGLDQASTGPRLGLERASCKPRLACKQTVSLCASPHHFHIRLSFFL